MTSDELVQFLAQVAAFWPDFEHTPALLGLWRERLGGVAYSDALRALKDHRVKSKVKAPHLGAVLDLLPRRAIGEREELPLSAIIRRQWHQAGGDTAGMSAADILVGHYSRLWFRSSGSDGARRMLDRQVRNALRAEKIHEDEIDVLAPIVFNRVPAALQTQEVS